MFDAEIKENLEPEDLGGAIKRWNVKRKPGAIFERVDMIK